MHVKLESLFLPAVHVSVQPYCLLCYAEASCFLSGAKDFVTAIFK